MNLIWERNNPNVQGKEISIFLMYFNHRECHKLSTIKRWPDIFYTYIIIEHHKQYNVSSPQSVVNSWQTNSSMVEFILVLFPSERAS